jgi:hypothetical protein
LACAHLGLDKCDVGVRDIDQHLARTGHRIRDCCGHQHLRWSKLTQYDGPHVRSILGDEKAPARNEGWNVYLEKLEASGHIVGVVCALPALWMEGQHGQLVAALGCIRGRHPASGILW